MVQLELDTFRSDAYYFRSDVQEGRPTQRDAIWDLAPELAPLVANAISASPALNVSLHNRLAHNIPFRLI
jgi:hypothetical protein